MPGITPGTAQEALAAWDAGQTLIAVALPFSRVDYIYAGAMEIIRRMPEFNQTETVKFADTAKELGVKMKFTPSELEMAKAVAWRALVQGWAASVLLFGSEGTIEIKKA